MWLFILTVLFLAVAWFASIYIHRPLPFLVACLIVVLISMGLDTPYLIH